MSEDDQIQQLGLNFEPVISQSLSGFRLRRLELFNWGTFNRQVWSMNLDGQNALLTGDIGSGKSTLVDAVTTLLVPSHRVAYNKAAGADSKERNLRSYVLGFYKSERSEHSENAKPVPLRGQNTYSVILGVFHNQGYGQTVTLAQVFWMKDLQSPPARFFVGAETELSIAEHFSNFGTDVAALRKRLKSDGAEVFESFPNYGSWFRRRFGIENEQALELFHQTVSMKSVGNLTDFVRVHMLESFDLTSQLQQLLHHFDDLTSAHDAVLKAVKQVEMLIPIVADCSTRAAVEAQSEQFRAYREALKYYFYGLKCSLLEERISDLENSWLKANAQVMRTTEKFDDARNDEIRLKQNISENGGDRLDKLRDQIQRKELELAGTRAKSERYDQLLKSIEQSAATDSESFIDQRNVLSRLARETQDLEAKLDNQLTELAVSHRDSKAEHEELLAEIKSLKSRRSNLPASQIALRTSLCAQLNLKEDEMPFAGELLQVHEEDKDWEGAIERVLHTFALSLLVPESHYAAVSAWVDRTHLKGRLVYYRVRGASTKNLESLHRDSLANKIAIKTGSAFYDWLDREVAHRFNYICCDNQEQFRREARAITHAGQIKGLGERHDKDDRFRIDDRSRFVLGWSNESKIRALESEGKKLEQRLAQLHSTIAKLELEKKKIKLRSESLSKLEEYHNFQEIDWRTVSAELSKLTLEKQQIETTSDILKQLTQKLAELVTQIADIALQLDAHKTNRAKLEQRKSDANDLLAEIKSFIEDPEYKLHESQFEKLESLRSEKFQDQQLTVESCIKVESSMRDFLQSRIESENGKLSRLDIKIVGAMSEYKKTFQLETQDFDASVKAGFEYKNVLQSLQADDLPRFQTRFKELLNENTIREVATFQSLLAQEREKIKDRIKLINASLTQIPYNHGRYIILLEHQTQDADIRDFSSELKKCTEGAMTGSEDTQYSEAKFLQVKQIIERFRGREGQAEQDRKWTAKVTDVRNWFTFSASERYTEDDKEFEHYTDSGGKSGGQKEKLAYTILAASLAYQFGLEWGPQRSRTFRFVVIDEAFGRGSDDSTRYGLALFEKLDLQLLVVTPMQKVDIIEPYVRSVGFVHNDGGNASKIRNISIEEYRKEKEARSKQ